MKQWLTLALTAAFVLATAASSQAIHTQGKGGTGLDFNARGSWRVLGVIQDNWDFNSDASEEDYQLGMRARTWFDFATADGVKAVLGTEIGQARFGQTNNLQLRGDNTIFKVKHLYAQFPWPNSDVTISAGLQGVALPGIWSNPILDDDVAGLIVSMPLSDMLGLTLAWLRPYDLDHTGSSTFDGSAMSDEWDAFAAILPITLEGMSITPYAIYSLLGQDAHASILARQGYGAAATNAVPALLIPPGGLAGLATDDGTAWWLGFNARLTMFDPIYVALDAIYGSASLEFADEDFDREGFFVGLAAGMKMDMFTPELFAFYASGADDDTDEDGRMPVVSGDFTATSFFFDRSALGSGIFTQDTLNPSLVGMWAVGLNLKDISIAERLSHTFTVMYAQGTNDEESIPVLLGTGLSEDDTLIEFNFDTKYQMYEHLAAIVEIGYIIPDFDDYNLGEDDAAFKLATGVKYDF
jgi:hypothetical protein